VLLAISTFGQIVRLALGLVVAVVTTFISLRMLGVRRGWLQALLAGVSGWVIAAIVSAGLNDWDWSADSFLAVTIVIAIPTTMALMLLLDLFAPPGSLSRGSRAGLVAMPKPGRAIRQQVEPFTRYRELLGIMRHHGFGPAVGHKSRGDDDQLDASAPVEVRLREALEEAGGVFVKLGQIAATRIDLLPPQFCTELSRLQSRSTPVPADDVREVLEAELGRPVEQVFASFEWTPLAAASIAQTHTAVLVTGESVVVKVQRPGIDHTMKRDLAALNQLARLAERRTELGQDLQVANLANEFGRSLRAELNFLEETNNTDEMRIVVSDGSDILVPEVFREYCTRRVVVEERLLGTPLSEIDALDGVDRSALARELLRVNIDHILHRGVFHADPHPGNIMVLDDGGLGMIDFGATGRLDGIQQQAVVDMLIALVKRDYRLLSDGLERVADVGAHISRQKLDRSLAQLLAKYTRPNGVVDTAVLADLVPLLSSFQIVLPGDLVVLFRALITLDGTLGVLSPGFSVTEAGMELGREQMADEGGDPNEMVQKALIAELPVLRRLPSDVGRSLTLLSRGELQVRTVASEDNDRFLRTLVNRAVLAFVGGVLAVSSVLLMGIEAGPHIGDNGARLTVAIGAGGLFFALLLLMRVIAMTVRDGTA